VGSSGTGGLSVTGGAVANGNGFLGLSAGSVGTATVSSGTWVNTRLLYVGFGGTGTLDVTGGAVTNSNGIIGTNGGIGTVTVSSGMWGNGGQLYVGGYTGLTGAGTGTLDVTGGEVRNTVGNIAFGGGVGTATVSSGTWTNSVAIHVGRNGTGTLDVVGGLVTSGSGIIGTLVSGTGTATVSSGTWSNSGALVVGGAGTGTLTISGSGGSGGVVIVGGTLSKGGAGTINLNAGGTLQIGTGSATGALGTDLVNNGALVFNRTGSSTVSSAISGTGALTKQGAGTLTFSGTSSYSGATAIDAGSFLVSGALGSSAVSVNAGGLLGGSGTIGGSITANASGTLSPGTAIESLATGAVALLDQSTFAYEMNSAVPLAADLLSVTGNLSLSGTVGLTLTDLATTPSAFAAGTTFSLINYTGSWNSGLFSYGGSVLADGGMFSLAGQLWTIDYNATAGGLNFSGEYLPASNFVNIATVPEPSACALGLAGLTQWRRRWAAKNAG
jgi:T5SS/PEP-CTERM-associated repeat protein